MRSLLWCSFETQISFFVVSFSVRLYIKYCGLDWNAYFNLFILIIDLLLISLSIIDDFLTVVLLYIQKQTTFFLSFYI